MFVLSHADVQVPSQFIRSRILCLKWQKQVLEAKQQQLVSFLEANGVSYKLAAAEVKNPLQLLAAAQQAGMLLAAAMLICIHAMIL